MRGMEQGRGRGERDPGWPGGLFLNSPLQAPLAFLGVGVGAEGLSLRPHRSRPQLHLRVHAAYGSTKDVAVYSSISLSPMQI